jgi:hypothetical protein
MRFGRAGGPGGPVIGVVLGRGLGLGLALGAGVSGRDGGPVMGVVLGRGLGLGLGLELGLVPGAGVGNGTLGGVTGAVTLGTDAIGCGGDAAGGVATLGADTVGFSTAMAKMRASWRRAQTGTTAATIKAKAPPTLPGTCAAAHSKAGATEGMNEHTFGCFNKQGDKRQYVKTIEALEQYMRKTYKFSEDFASLFANTPSTPTVKKPIPILKSERNKTDELIFKEEIKQYVIQCTALNGNLAAI